MPPLAKNLAKERAARLRARGSVRLGEFLDGEIGRRRSVLVERGGSGRTEHFAPVRIEGATPGTILPVRIRGHAGGELVAAPIEQAA
jgi:threonylcarbamoyladenosine tRNA methylthiotransferase MtaB